MPFQHNGIVMTDLEGRIKYANVFMCDLLGVEYNKIHERSALEFAFREDLESARRLFASSQSPGAKPFRFRLRRSDGTAVSVDVMCSAMKTAEGTMYGVIATVTPAKA
jgi:PAS domain S-box-containing protein